MSVRYRLDICYFYIKLYELWLGLCCNIRMVYRYESDLPSKQNYVIMANHESSWDAYALTTLLRPSTTVLKKELLRMPLFGWSLAMIKPISLSRENIVQSTKRVFIQGQDALKNGYNLVIFPQGTRSKLPYINRFNPSAVNLSIKSGYPLLLVAHNSGELLPVGKFLKHPGQLSILVSEPIYPVRHSKESLNKLVLEKMEEMIKQTHRKEVVFV